MSSTITQFRLLPSGAWHLGVVVRRTYVLDGRDWRAYLDDPRVADDDEETPWKPTTDIVVRGHIYAPGGGARETSAHIEIGDTAKSIRATGDRVIEAVRGGVPRFSAPSMFERVPLTYERSYGGFDLWAYETVGDSIADLAVEAGADIEVVSRFAYPRNPRGVGFYVGGPLDRLVGAALPNLDDVLDPVTPERIFVESALDWVDAPMPAALDWMPPTSFPRCLHFGFSIDHRRSTRPMAEVALGAITENDLITRGEFHGIFDARALSGAAAGMSRRRLVGGEPIRLAGLHRTDREIASALPSERPAVTITPPGCPATAIDSELHSVLFDLDSDSVTLGWGAKLQIAGPYPHDELALVSAQTRFV